MGYFKLTKTEHNTLILDRKPNPEDDKPKIKNDYNAIRNIVLQKKDKDISIQKGAKAKTKVNII